MVPPTGTYGAGQPGSTPSGSCCIASASLRRAARSRTGCSTQSGNGTVLARCAGGGVLLVHRGESLRSDPVDEAYEGGPETPVDWRDLPVHETKPDHIVRRRCFVQHADDLVVLRVLPPAARDASARDQFREVPIGPLADWSTTPCWSMSSAPCIALIVGSGLSRYAGRAAHSAEVWTSVSRYTRRDHRTPAFLQRWAVGSGSVTGEG